MSKRTSIITILLGILLLTSPLVQAAGGSRSRLVWTKKQNSRTGLYTTKNYFVSHGVGGSIGALYYFGDVDNIGLAFNGGFNVKNLSIGGGLHIMYQLPISNHCNMRFALMGGTLSGNNKAMYEKLSEPRDDYRKFNAFFIQPAVGVQYYPFNSVGFYLYGGLALTGSIITNYEFYYYPNVGGKRVRDLVDGKTFGILPMIQLGIGYTFSLNESWSLGLEFMIQEGLLDTYYMNLDAFPLAASQNGKGVELGSGTGIWSKNPGSGKVRWNDGWFQFGITFTYQWRNCERCRMINNYNNVTARSR